MKESLLQKLYPFCLSIFLNAPFPRVRSRAESLEGMIENDIPLLLFSMCFEGERPLAGEIAFGSGGRMEQINNDSAKMNNAREKWESCRGGGLKLRFASWEICEVWNETKYIDSNVLDFFESTGSKQVAAIESRKKKAFVV